MLDFSSLTLLAYIFDAVSKHRDFGMKVHRNSYTVIFYASLDSGLVYAHANDVDRAKK